MFRTMCGFVLLAVICCTAESFADKRSHSEVIAKNGMAATSHPLATQIAVDILKKGGTAVDAAIAANAALGLMEPMSCGIGGDLYAIVWEAQTKKLYGINASGRSPVSLTYDHLQKQDFDQIPVKGVLSLSVPGCVDGWFELHKRFGVLSMFEILAPSIEYAINGFPVTEVIAKSWARGLDSHKDYPNFEDIYSLDGLAPEKGDIFTNAELANTYIRLARDGRDDFYTGETAEAIADFVKEQGGFLTKEDLAAHSSEWVEPVSTNYRGYDVWQLPPNGQGIAVLQMLNILESYDLKSMGFGSADHVHTILEAKKLAFEDRAKFYADMAFNEIPVGKLISKEYAGKRRKLIMMKQAGSDYRAGDLTDGETVYLCTADKYGNMVSFIQSIYWGFGSGVVPAGLGFVLQNRGALFTLERGHFNVYEPAKRPFHTIIPAFVTQNDEPLLAFGVMGGDFQPQGQVQVLVNILDFGMDLQEAGDAPRFAHTGSSTPRGDKANGSGKVGLEDYFPPGLDKALEKRGHDLSVGNEVMFYGGYQAIKRDPKSGVYIGATELRKDGVVGGY